MMQVPAAEVEDCLQWISEQMNRPFSLANDFAISSKIYITELCSFTTIQPGKNKDDYWCNDDMCKHVIEAVLTCKWVHRRLELTSFEHAGAICIYFRREL
jgi:hypothetical protein